MEAAFLLDENGRSNFLRLIAQAFASTYICLWSYIPNSPKACLFFKDGFYQPDTNQPTSSSGSLASRLFEEYSRTVFILENDRIPGLAFNNSIPYIELNGLELTRRVSTEIQKQFYQEARIKTAVFMGFKNGEIELGWSSVTQVNMEMEMRNWISENFMQQPPVAGEKLPPATDQIPHSSSSSSLRSLSTMDSPEYSSLLFNPTNTTPRAAATDSSDFDFQALQTLNRIRNVHLPTLELENAAMTQAILAVLSSSSDQNIPHQNVQHVYRVNLNRSTAFKKYSSSLIPNTHVGINSQTTSMLKRAIKYFSSLNSLRIQERNLPVNRPTSTQLHHMISERKRREKLNESFQSLRSLLPAGSKKDKASVLTSSREYLSALKAQVEELTERNKVLEAQVLGTKESNDEVILPSINGNFDARIQQIHEGMVDLQVTITRETPMMNLVIHLLEFIKQITNISLISINASTPIANSTSTNRIVLRLQIEGNEWEESAFLEAVRRILANLAQ